MTDRAAIGYLCLGAFLGAAWMTIILL